MIKWVEFCKIVNLSVIQLFKDSKSIVLFYFLTILSLILQELMFHTQTKFIGLYDSDIKVRQRAKAENLFPPHNIFILTGMV